MIKELRRKIVRKLTGKRLARLIYLLLWLFRLTMRVRVIGGEIMPGFVARGEGFIGTFWHGRLLMLPFLYPGKRISILIGTHRDGQLIADVIECFGFGLVRGSSSKGGREAYREMLKLLKENSDLGITPDGPRGPAEVCKIGVAHVAKLSGKAVIPMAFSASPAIRGTSWDRFMIPLPFSRCIFLIGDPVRYEAGEDVELFRLRIESALREVTVRADEMIGTAVRPAANGQGR